MKDRAIFEFNAWNSKPQDTIIVCTILLRQWYIHPTCSRITIHQSRSNSKILPSQTFAVPACYAYQTTHSTKLKNDYQYRRSKDPSDATNRASFQPAEAVITETGLCVAEPLGLAAQHVPFSLPSIDAKLNALFP